MTEKRIYGIADWRRRQRKLKEEALAEPPPATANLLIDNTPGSDYTEWVSWDCPHDGCCGSGSFERPYTGSTHGAVEIRRFECGKCKRQYEVRFD